ncbi:MAG: MBL fold metallo-hydrolase [Ignavibacteriales bacterium]|nr:MBL fold metallo-hydrolase [Ignavibacteriales bacterium]
MKIGKYKIQLIETGTFALDGGAMFGIIPKPLWEKNNPADNANRVSLTARCLLLSYEKKNILIDTGFGNKWDEKSNSIYNFNQQSANLNKSLKLAGVDREAITDVILTHLHFDHTGGSTTVENGKIVPSFPNATYFVQKQNFDWAMNPSEKDRGSYIKDNFLPLYEKGVLKFINGNEPFDDEIEFIQINGHTFGQQLVKISDSLQTLLYCGDLLPFSSHIHLPFIMGYDLQPLVTLNEKKKILNQAVDEEWKLIFEHDPFLPAVTIQKIGEKFLIKEKIKI